MLFATYFDDVRRMSAACTLCVEGVNCTSLHRRNGGFDKA